MSLLNIITELKKTCNHPFLFESAEEDYRGGEDDLNAVDRLVVTSGKMVLLDKLMKRLKETGHRLGCLSAWRYPVPTFVNGRQLFSPCLLLHLYKLFVGDRDKTSQVAYYICSPSLPAARNWAQPNPPSSSVMQLRMLHPHVD